MPIPTWETGQVLSADDINEWFVPKFAYKTSNTTISSSTTPTTDPHLVVTVASSGVYQVEAMLLYAGTTTGDFAAGWSYPSGTQGTWGPYGNGTTVVSSTSGLDLQSNVAANTWGYMVRTEATDISATRTFGGTGVGNVYSAHAWALIRVSSTSGDFALSWAQGGSDSTATTLYADSYLKLTRVA